MSESKTLLLSVLEIHMISTALLMYDGVPFSRAKKNYKLPSLKTWRTLDELIHKIKIDAVNMIVNQNPDLTGKEQWDLAMKEVRTVSIPATGIEILNNIFPTIILECKDAIGMCEVHIGDYDIFCKLYEKIKVI